MSRHQIWPGGRPLKSPNKNSRSMILLEIKGPLILLINKIRVKFPHQKGHPCLVSRKWRSKMKGNSPTGSKGWSWIWDKTKSKKRRRCRSFLSNKTEITRTSLICRFSTMKRINHRCTPQIRTIPRNYLGHRSNSIRSGFLGCHNRHYSWVKDKRRTSRKMSSTCQCQEIKEI